MVRPEEPRKPLPTLLEFTIRDSQNLAKECAAHGYVGVVAYAGAKRAGSRRAAPYQHDGDDARTVINWIAKQSWSDGRVAMYGDGYSGFTAVGCRNQIAVPRSRPLPPPRPAAPGHRCPHGRKHLSKLCLPMVFASHQHQRRARRELSRTMHCGDALNEKWYRSGSTIPRFGPAVRAAQSDLHSLAESPELRPVLAKDDALPRTIRAHRYPGADDYRLLRCERAGRLVLLHPALSI